MKHFIVAVFVIFGSGSSFAQSWQYIAPMQHARAEAEAVMLKNGNILVAGGYGSGSVLTSCEIYNPRSNTWKETGDMLTPRYRFELKLLPSGKVVAFGGLIDLGVGTTANCEIYDPNAGTWSALPSMSDPREDFPSAYLDDSSILVASGLNANNTSYPPSCEIFDAKTLSFHSITPMLIGCYSQFGLYIPSIHTYVTGSGDIGGVGGDYLRSTENYDLATNTWSLGDSLTVPTCDQNRHTVQLSDGTIVVPGGRSGMNSVSTIVQVFDPKTKHWYDRGNLIKPHFHCASFLIGEDSILNVGGVTDPAYAQNIVSYCTWYRFSDSSSWQGPDLLEPVQVYASTEYKFPEPGSCGDREMILIFGGETASRVPISRCEALDMGVVPGVAPVSPSFLHRSAAAAYFGQIDSLPLIVDVSSAVNIDSLWPTLTEIQGTYAWDSSVVSFLGYEPPAGWVLNSLANHRNSLDFDIQDNGSTVTQPLDLGTALFKPHTTELATSWVALPVLTLTAGGDVLSLCTSQNEDSHWSVKTLGEMSGVTLTQPLPEREEIILYPNPVGNALFIKNPGAMAHVSLFDALGREVASSDATAHGTSTLDVRTLPAGVYFARIMSGNVVTEQSFVKR